jgi:hypothetical protein
VATSTALLVGLDAQTSEIVGGYLSSNGVAVTAAGADRDAFRICMTGRFDVVVASFTDNATQVALLVESMTLVNPTLRIAAIEPADGASGSGSVGLSLSKAFARIKSPLEGVDLSPLLS